jgi:hypothetical protein
MHFFPTRHDELFAITTSKRKNYSWVILFILLVAGTIMTRTIDWKNLNATEVKGNVERNAKG